MLKIRDIVYHIYAHPFSFCGSIIKTNLTTQNKYNTICQPTEQKVGEDVIYGNILTKEIDWWSNYEYARR